jgi:hypothetical protein
MENADRFVSLQTRLALYGLERRQDRLADLRIESGQTVELDAADPSFAEHHARLKPRSLQDLKRWIGIPDDAVQVVQREEDGVRTERREPICCAPHVAQPAILPENPDMQNNLHRYLFGHSSSIEDHHLRSMETFLSSESIAISIYVLRDIYIAKGARLVVPEKCQVLFARYITVETTGLLDLKATFARIDCAGMRRLPPFLVDRIDRSAAYPAATAIPRSSD